MSDYLKHLDADSPDKENTESKSMAYVNSVLLIHSYFLPIFRKVPQFRHGRHVFGHYYHVGCQTQPYLKD